MSRKYFSHSLLRGIFDDARKIRMFTSPHRPSLAAENQTGSQALLHLPDVLSPVQYLIDMGLRPTLAQHMSTVYMEFVSRQRQVFKSYFRRVIRGGSHQPVCYHDMFVVQFRRTIQVLGSQFVSIVRIWLCRAGISPIASHPQCLDIRVDDITKEEILLRLGLKPTSLTGLSHNANIISQSTEECPAKREYSIKSSLVLLEPRPAVGATAATCDLFCREAPSTCFPAYYPPPPSESVPSSQKIFATAFSTTSIRNDDKQLAKHCANMSSLTNLFSRMTATVHEVGPELRGSSKGSWIPNSQKKVPLSPLLPPNILDVSGPSYGQQPMTGSVSSATSAVASRKRRIAALPKRHTETPDSLSTRSSPSPLPCGSSLTVVYPPNPTSHTSVELATKSAVTENAHPDCVLAPPRTIDVQSTLPVQNRAETSKSVVSKERRKTLSRKAHSRSQPVPSLRQAPASPTLPEWRVSASSRTVSRTPSLVSDTSSIDSSPSSDELDTPPSTPSSSLLELPTHGNNIATLLAPPAMSTPRKRPLGRAKPPRPREKGVHIDFTRGRIGNDSEEGTFTFTFSS